MLDDALLELVSQIPMNERQSETAQALLRLIVEKQAQKLQMSLGRQAEAAQANLDQFTNQRPQPQQMQQPAPMPPQGAGQMQGPGASPPGMAPPAAGGESTFDPLMLDPMAQGA